MSVNSHTRGWYITYTRIDYFLIGSKLTAVAKSPKYHNILISDLGPVTISMDFGWKKAHSNWRFNPSLLNDKTFWRNADAR